MPREHFEVDSRPTAPTVTSTPSSYFTDAVGYMIGGAIGAVVLTFTLVLMERQRRRGSR